MRRFAWILAGVALACGGSGGSGGGGGPKSYVAVGTQGEVYYSTGGTTWTKGIDPTIRNLNAVTWNGNTFAAVGVAGKLLRSVDGHSWDVQTESSKTDINAIVAHEGWLCAVGRSGLTLTSPDGATWTPHTSLVLTEALHAVTWTGTKYLAVGDEGFVATSPDCVGWVTKAPLATHPTLVDVIQFGGSTVALGDGYAYSSTDGGASWTPHQIAANPVFWMRFATDGNQLLVAGFGNMAGPRIRATTDLTTWTKVYSDAVVEHALMDIHWDGDRFLAVGAKGFLLVSDATGTAWTPGAIAATEQTIQGIASH